MTVALNDLRRNRRDRQAQPLADFLLDFRTEMRARAHGAGNFTDGHFRGGAAEARDVAAILSRTNWRFSGRR